MPDMFSLVGSPYSLETRGAWVLDEASRLHDRVGLLRSQGQLTEQTLRAYFGDKRFEQIAESNAIEGSTLTVGETKMAVERGIAITGHDPATPPMPSISRGRWTASRNSLKTPRQPIWNRSRSFTRWCWATIAEPGFFGQRR